MIATRPRVSPVLIAVLMAIWLLMNETLAPGQFAFGLGLSILLAGFSSTLRPLHARVRRLDQAVALFFVVFRDIVRSNLAVARIVLGLAGKRAVRSGFVRIPLELRDEHGLAVLAAIITATPGTVWAGLSPDGSTLTLHILDLRDEAEWIPLIKQRYEQPLMRIFQ